jgi:hypothetical protein
MFQPILKTCFMLFRNAVMWVLMFAWIIKGISGAGHVLGMFVYGSAALAIALTMGSIKPGEAVAMKLSGPFWRCVEVLSQYLLLIAMVWFAHYAFAFAWMIACIGITLLRHRILEAKKAAMKAKNESIMGEFASRMKSDGPMPSAMSNT